MKKTIINTTLFLCLFFLSACGDDDGNDFDGTFTVQSNIRNAINPNLLILTNEEGAILYDTIGLIIDQNVTIDVEEDDKIDVTYGYESESAFRLVTFRDVKSNFELSPSWLTCDADFESGFANFKTMELQIEGVHEYERLYYPFHRKEVESDPVNNTLTLKGTISTQNDLLFTIHPIGMNYKSMVIKYEDWVEEANETLSAVVHIDDFKSSEVHEINVGEANNWIVNAKIQSSDGRKITAALWTTYTDNQEGDKIKLFSTDDFEVAKVKLEIKNGLLTDSREYLKVLDAIPSNITFFTPDIVVNSKAANNYNVNIGAAYDVAIIKYNYIIDNVYSSWSIYQKADAGLSYQLPTLPATFLNQASKLNDNLDSPTSLIVNAYKGEDNTLIENYDEESVDSKLKCFDYKARVLGEEF